MRSKLILFILLLMFATISSHAQTIGAVRGSTFKIESEVSDLKINDKYFVVDGSEKKKAVVQIVAVDPNKGAIGKVLKGQVQPGWKVLNTKSRNVASEGHSILHHAGNHNAFSAFGFLFTGSGSSATGSTTVGGVTVGSTTTSSSATGLSLGAGYDYWFDDLSVGGEYRFSSVSFSGNGGSSSGTAHEIGATVGYLLKELPLKLVAGYYLFGSVSFDGASASGPSGFKLGAHYRINDQIGVLGEYRSISYSSVSVSGASVSGASISMSTFNVGGSYYF